MLRIICPHCSTEIEVPLTSRVTGSVIHIISPGSLVLCPKCGANLRKVMEGEESEKDRTFLRGCALFLFLIAGLGVGYVLCEIWG